MVDYSRAIKLSAPICVISAMRAAAKQWILVKGGKYLEAFANADTIVFDKTGTLTRACPRAARAAHCGGRSRNEVLKIAVCPADVSVAMKDGSDIAKEASDITLASENLDGLITRRHLSKALFKSIGQRAKSV